MAKWSYCWQQVVNKSCCQWLPASDHLVLDRLLTVLHPVVKRTFPQSIGLLYRLNLRFEKNPSCFATTQVGDSQIRKHLIKFLQLRVEDPLCNYSSRLPWQWARERIALLAIWERERRERHTWVALELETLCTGETFQGRQPSPGNLWLSFTTIRWIIKRYEVTKKKKILKRFRKIKLTDDGRASFSQSDFVSRNLMSHNIPD